MGSLQPEAARMKKQFSFSMAVEGYLLAATARHLSEHTLLDYSYTFRKFHTFLHDDPPIASITAHQVEAFLAVQKVSKKTILNYHIGLSALWTWVVQEGLAPTHILHQVARARPEKKSIVPFSEADVRAMLGALGSSKLYSRPYRRENTHSLPNQERNRAIILMLLDTGMRASELCELRIHHVDVRNRRLTVFGKGSKERTLPFSARTGQALWKYMALREKDTAGDSLFMTMGEGAMDRDRLLKTLMAIGKRAGVGDVNVHRFRHTFAINYLRNGGDAYSLQMMLGHSTMEMVKTYLALAQADLEKTHKMASPVDNWRL
jgi:integrase/recombinase XerD